MDGFNKIELPTSEKSTQKSRFSRFKRPRLKSRRALAVLAVILSILVFLIIIPAITTYASFKKTKAQASIALTVLKKQNVDEASVELKKTRESLTQTQKNLNSLFIVGFIPVINGYYDDSKHLVKAGFHGLDAAEVLVDSVKPYSDVLGLKGQGSFAGGTAEQRIQTAVKTMDKITPKIDDLARDLTLAREEIDHVNPDDYPTFLIGEKTKKQLVQFRALTDNGVTFVNDAKPLIKILPSLMGEPNEKKYLVIFQNDKELRPTGGFITAYSIFRLHHGVIKVDTSNDIYTLDASISNKSKAPRPIALYLPNVPQFNLRDSNISPDFAQSMETLTAMYKKSSLSTDIDGIIAVDTQALVAAMNILGDIEVGGTTYSTKIDPRCNCPQVIYEMEVYADQPVGYIKGNRKSLIGDMMFAIMNKAFSSSPKIYWGPLFQAMVSQVGEKNILFYLYNKDAQAGVAALNAGGRIMAADGDYLHINEANFGGAKSNLFVEERVTQDYKVETDGSIVKTVTIDYKNPHPPSDCNLERGGLCLNATLRDWIRVYVPKGSKLIDTKGSTVKVINYDELGKTVFEGFLQIRPMGIAQYTLSYKLPFKLEKGSPLPLMIQKQPGATTNEYTLTTGGKTINKLNLATDKTLTLDL